MKACDFIWKVLADEAKVRPPHVFMTWHAMRERGASFNPATFAAFAGLEEKHILAIMAAFTNHNIRFREPRQAEERGTRLPADFQMPAEWIMAAREKRLWSEDDTKAEAENFIAYWAAKAGKEAVKLNWRLTWNRWVANSNRPNGTHSPHVTFDAASDIERLEKLINLYRRMGRNEDIAALERDLHAARNRNVVPFKAANR